MKKKPKGLTHDQLNTLIRCKHGELRPIKEKVQHLDKAIYHLGRLHIPHKEASRKMRITQAKMKVIQKEIQGYRDRQEMIWQKTHPRCRKCGLGYEKTKYRIRGTGAVRA